MTSELASDERCPRLEIGRRGARRRRPSPQWRRALRALRNLLDDPDRTEFAFEVFEALDPDQHARSLSCMLDHAEGRRVYAERPSLLGALGDREALERLPEESLGRAYLQHIDRHGLDPGKLVELGRQRERVTAPDAELRWVAERSELCHDLWHVLSGYGADGAGESALLLFSLAQTGGRSNLLLSAGANLRMLRERGLRWIPYAWTAWRRGRRAVCLHALPYERLLPLPLSLVRRAAGIEPPERAHPGGVIRSEVSGSPASGTPPGSTRDTEASRC